MQIDDQARYRIRLDDAVVQTDRAWAADIRTR